MQQTQLHDQKKLFVDIDLIIISDLFGLTGQELTRGELIERQWPCWRRRMESLWSRFRSPVLTQPLMEIACFILEDDEDPMAFGSNASNWEA
jgi:hypothetical protein